MDFLSSYQHILLLFLKNSVSWRSQPKAMIVIAAASLWDGRIWHQYTVDHLQSNELQWVMFQRSKEFIFLGSNNLYLISSLPTLYLSVLENLGLFRPPYHYLAFAWFWSHSKGRHDTECQFCVQDAFLWSCVRSVWDMTRDAPLPPHQTSQDQHTELGSE